MKNMKLTIEVIVSDLKEPTPSLFPLIEASLQPVCGMVRVNKIVKEIEVGPWSVVERTKGINEPT